MKGRKEEKKGAKREQEEKKVEEEADEKQEPGEREEQQDEEDEKKDDKTWGKGKYDKKPGDWTFPSCGDLQFARNTSCRKCGGTPASSSGKSSYGNKGGHKGGNDKDRENMACKH